jgi:hypothetical protein
VFNRSEWSRWMAENELIFRRTLRISRKLDTRFA